MCGINGFTFRDETLIARMNEATHHRGPDQTDVWCSDGISFGHNRLAIIDLSERAKQPMHDLSGRYTIVFNGEIYNFQELKKELGQKYAWFSTSDTEVVLNLYQEYGPECVKKLNGIFALAIWDTAKQELFIARDQLGIKPFYYWHENNRFIFSSEIKGILAHGMSRSVNQTAANFYFNLLYIPEPLTLFEGIKKLPVAHYGQFKNGQLELKRYWEVTDFSDLTSRPAAVSEVRALFDDAVHRQLISDRPVGVFLSGGLDSTAILGAARKYLPGKVATFSVGFVTDDEVKFNADVRLARQTAALYGTEHHELMVSATDVQNNLSKVVWHLGESNFNPTAAAIFLLAKEAKKEVAVVLGGDGADELFGGYPRYYYSRLLSQYQRLPSGLRALVRSALMRTGKQSLATKLDLPPSADRVLAFLAQKESAVSSIFSPDLAGQSALKQYFTERYFSGSTPVDFEKHFMNIDRQSWLVDESLLRTDAMTMAFGLEERVPILDRRLVELSYRIPTAWKIDLFKNTPRHFQGKTIWREAIAPYLPEHILRQQKRGWFTPMAKWVRSDLKDYVSEIIAPENLDETYFNRAGVQRMWADHLSGKQYNLNSIWAIVMWQLWLDQFMKQ
jgi:asparagine synthase (glutamine-hydrolysing)